VVVAYPLISPLSDQVDEFVVRPVGEQLTEQPAQRRAPWLLDQAFHQRVLQHRLHILIAQHGHRGPHRGGELSGEALGVGGLCQPTTQPTTDPHPAQLVEHHVLGEEVRAHEVTEVVPELVLFARNDTGVRDRQSERMAEQRGHGEPVGQRADHAGLGHRRHISHPWGSVDVDIELRDDEYHRGAQQER